MTTPDERNAAAGDAAVSVVLIRLRSGPTEGLAVISHLDARGGEVEVDRVAADAESLGLAAVSAWVRREIPAGNSRLIIDISGVDWVNSTLMGWLVSLHETVNRAGGALAVVMRMDRALSILRITKLDRVLVICDSIDAAKARLLPTEPGPR